MLNLQSADFSAVYNTPNHEFLRRGIIQRQNNSGDLVAPAAQAKLRRFARRWERLSGKRLGPAAKETDSQAEVSLVEQAYHRLIGSFLFAVENAKRLVFEFLPMPWLRTYRLFKNWMFSRDLQPDRVSVKEQFQHHSITIFASFLLWAAIVWLDHLTGPEFTFGPLYLIPCATLALVVNRGWASVAAASTAIAITVLRFGEIRALGQLNLTMEIALAWNLCMRFVFFEVFVLLLDRIRVELIARNNAATIPPPANLEKA